jgi:hypothetical protein
MRYALISDIHANLPALERVIDRIRKSDLPNDFAEYLRTGGRPAATSLRP